MALTSENKRLTDTDPEDLTAYERGQLRALAMGADRVEVEQRQQRRRDAAADATEPTTAFERGVARARAAGGPPSKYAFEVTGPPPDTKID